ncbi:class I SAM-dependent methyltransferase [Ochrovirga pacifica]|uniref:class I SAM-dependent methyltransferase n=1 Tax=Ochrovirga pacifica TaxID=1042376 RepID=UPI000255A2BB|nr:class I SAM-dependent methyltransferase [Ochrovirga pacifica]
MNTNLLKNHIQQYILQHLKTDITQLVFKGSPFVDVDMHELLQQLESKRKCEKKLPLWFRTDGIYYPNKLNIEQTSSETTASFKSEMIEGGNRIIDITGGFGVDCHAFSSVFAQVIHCELNSELSEMVQHNNQVLGIKNIQCIQGDGVQYVIDNNQHYDWIYIDPSRRNDAKGKVFLLKDCLPNVPMHLDSLLEKTNQILIKNSPLIDISSCINELKFVKKIHVVALHNEVKEVLVCIEKNYEGKIDILATNLDKESNTFRFTYQQEYPYELSKPLTYLYEPNSAILKSGGFAAVCDSYNVCKLHQHSHLYTSNTLVPFAGRRFKILHNLPYHKKQLLKLLPEKKANITTRNFKESVATIRKKTGIKEGGNIYLFFTTNLENEQVVLVCEKII